MISLLLLCFAFVAFALAASNRPWPFHPALIPLGLALWVLAELLAGIGPPLMYRSGHL